MSHVCVQYKACQYPGLAAPSAEKAVLPLDPGPAPANADMRYVCLIESKRSHTLLVSLSANDLRCIHVNVGSDLRPDLTRIGVSW